MPNRLLQTIRLDASDDHVFSESSQPGEWAVSGAFSFLSDQAPLTGKRKQAFSNGFLGLGSLGWSTFVAVADARDEDVETAISLLANHLFADFGAPSFEAATKAAHEEVQNALDLAEGQPINTLLTVSRSLDEAGQIHESYRVVTPPAGDVHTRIWDVVEDKEPAS